MSLWQTRCAVVGYNPHKPGRPSHSYHSALMANTRLALAVEVMPGNETAPTHSMPGIWAWLDALPPSERPALLRGDIAYGNESVLAAQETRNQPYLTKLRLTTNVKRLITRLFAHTDWEKAGQGWEGREDTLPLSGWTRARRVVVLRRRLKGDVVLSPKDDPQGTLAFIESSVATAGYEYAIPSGTQGDSSHRPLIRFSRSLNSTAITPGLRTISTN
ncbi:MAG: transposase [Burkholderiales bacterium]